MQYKVNTRIKAINKYSFYMVRNLCFRSKFSIATAAHKAGISLTQAKEYYNILKRVDNNCTKMLRYQISLNNIIQYQRTVKKHSHLVNSLPFIGLFYVCSGKTLKAEIKTMINRWRINK